MEYTRNNGHKLNGGTVSSVSALTGYASLVKSRALSFSACGCEVEDLVQEGNIGLLTAAATYNGELSSFSTFARRCIDAAIIDYLRKTHKMSDVPKSMLVDINGLEVADSAPDIEYSLLMKEEYALTVNKAGELLSDFEYSVFSDLIRGYSQKEISEKNGASVKSVQNAVQRIRAKLK